MSRVADYSIVQDDSLTVVSLLYQRKFNVPPNLKKESRCILSFVVTKVTDVEDGSVTIKINGHTVYNATYPDLNILFNRGLQEVFGKDVLTVGENTMEIIGDFVQGSITISDIVVWFQVDSNIIGGSNTLGDIENGFMVLRKDDGKDRVRLDANFADLRMGGEGTNGDVLLFPSNVDTRNLDQAQFATVHLGSKDATLRMGVADLPGETGQKAGKILLRGGPSGSTRIRLDASADGDILLFPTNVESDAAATDASIQLDAGAGGAANTGGRIFLRGGSPEKIRILLDAGSADIKVGGNGKDGDIYLFPGAAAQQISTSATIRLDGETGEVRAATFIAGGITLNVPDYVWDSNYALMPIDELRTYTAREKRLPNIPSAAAIKHEGLNVSQFQMQLLEKVEELTRYLLMQQEAIQLQQARIEALGSQLQWLSTTKADL